MIAIFSAMKGEVGESLPGFEADLRRVKGGLSVVRGKYYGQSLMLITTGVGKKNAQRAANFVLSGKQKPKRVLVVGFGGGMRKDLKENEIIVCDPIFAKDQPPISPDSCLKDLCLGVLDKREADFRLGKNLTSLEFVQEPKEKRKLAGLYPGLTVAEMENYWIGLVATQEKIPFLAVRMIYDSIEERIPFPEERDGEEKRKAELRFRKTATKLRDIFLVPFLKELLT